MCVDRHSAPLQPVVSTPLLQSAQRCTSSSHLHPPPLFTTSIIIIIIIIIVIIIIITLNLGNDLAKRSFPVRLPIKIP
jgi:hypothetical protein